MASTYLGMMGPKRVNRALTQLNKGLSQGGYKTGRMPERRSNTVLKGAGLLSVATAGGALALVGAWLFGGFGSGTTTVREMLLESTTAPPPSSVASTDGMTIGQIYEHDAPGVVQITAI